MVASLLLAGAIGSLGPFADALLLVSGGFAIGLVITLFRSHRSKYDLEGLRIIHEQAEIDEIEVIEPVEFDSVQCVGCGSVYSKVVPVCPRCRRSQFG